MAVVEPAELVYVDYAAEHKNVWWFVIVHMHIQYAMHEILEEKHLLILICIMNE